MGKVFKVKRGNEDGYGEGGGRGSGQTGKHMSYGFIEKWGSKLADFEIRPLTLIIGSVNNLFTINAPRTLCKGCSGSCYHKMLSNV